MQVWTSVVLPADTVVGPALFDLIGKAVESAWKAINMKLGFASLVTAAVSASTILGTAAQCPDFTTYSQVTSPAYAERNARS